MKTALELVKSIKTSTAPNIKENVLLGIPAGMMIFNGGAAKSRIIYDDKIIYFNIEKEKLQMLIELKKYIMNKVTFDSGRFAVQRSLTSEEFEFVMLCDKKRISRKAELI